MTNESEVNTGSDIETDMDDDTEIVMQKIVDGAKTDGTYAIAFALMSLSSTADRIADTLEEIRNDSRNSALAATELAVHLGNLEGPLDLLAAKTGEAGDSVGGGLEDLASVIRDQTFSSGRSQEITRAIVSLADSVAKLTNGGWPQVSTLQSAVDKK
jgi:hypothetical protein